MNQLITKNRLLLLSSMLSLCLPAQATKLMAAPLPHRSELQTSNVQQISPVVSRFYPGEQNAGQGTTSAANDHSFSKVPNQDDQKKQAELEKAKAEKQRLQTALIENNKGVQLGQQGKFDEAIAAHEQAARLAPENKQYRINLSAAYCAYGQKQLSQHNFANASRLFRQALVAASDNGLAGRLLVESLKKTGIDPNNVDDRIAIGDQLLSQGDIAGAGIEYQAAELIEESAKTFVKMGDYVYHLGNPSLAASWYKQATVKNPDYGPAYRQLGLIALSSQNQTEAAELLRKAIILDSKDTAAGVTLVDLWHRQVITNPQVADNHFGLAGALQLTGDLSGAEAEYAKVASINPHYSSLPAAQASLKRAFQHREAQRHKEAATTLWDQGLKQEATAEISQAVRIEPKNAQYQFFLGQCLESIGDFQGAHQAYLTCVLIDPENNQQAAARMKSMQQSTTNTSPESQSTTKIVAAPQQIDNTTSTPVNDNTKSILDKVDALEAVHNYDAATNMLRQIVSNNLESPEMHHRLAVDLMSTGEIGEAISEFRIASALSPNQKIYADDLAQALAINKRSFNNEQIETSGSKQ